MNTVQLIDALRERHHLPSDYAAAALLGLTRAQLSRYRNGKDFLGDEQAAKVADLLELDAGYVAACVHAERARSPAIRSMWEGVAKKLERAGVAALAVFLSLWIGGGPDAGAQAATRASAQTASVNNSLDGSIHWRGY